MRIKQYEDEHLIMCCNWDIFTISLALGYVLYLSYGGFNTIIPSVEVKLCSKLGVTYIGAYIPVAIILVWSLKSAGRG